MNTLIPGSNSLDQTRGLGERREVASPGSGWKLPGRLERFPARGVDGGWLNGTPPGVWSK